MTMYQWWHRDVFRTSTAAFPHPVDLAILCQNPSAEKPRSSPGSVRVWRPWRKRHR